jgi:ABC-type multidrug transport system fused ATPase/permease subunit
MTPSTVLVSLSLFNTLILPLNNLPWMIGGVIEAWISANRFSEFLGQETDAFDCSSSLEAQDPEREDSSAHVWPTGTRSASRDTESNGRKKVSRGAKQIAGEAIEGHADLAIELIGASFSYQDICSTQLGNVDQANHDAMINTLSTMTFSVPKVCQSTHHNP